jgi:DNA-directed RNA polymerase sigma subunit (sigma70/sigma32)
MTRLSSWAPLASRLRTVPEEASESRIAAAEGKLAELRRRGPTRPPNRVDSGNFRVPGSPLSAERERELVVAAEGGDEEACRQLIQAFLPAIRGLARRFAAGGRVRLSELRQEGIAGLLFATRRYDPRAGTPFWAYASFWVRKAMQDLLAEVTRPVALSEPRGSRSCPDPSRPPRLHGRPRSRAHG